MLPKRSLDMNWQLSLYILCILFLAGLWVNYQLKNSYKKWREKQISLNSFVVELCGFTGLLILVSPLPQYWKLAIGAMILITFVIAFFTADRSRP